MAARGRPPAFDRTQVLSRAMEVFWSKGFAAASMAELSEAMGLNPPSIYRAFGNKEDLFRESVAHYALTAGAGIWEDVEETATARDAVQSVLTATASAYTRGGRPRGCMIVLAAPQRDGAHPAVSEELRKRRSTNKKKLASRFERAVSEGELPPNVSCERLAEYVATIQHGMSIQAQDGVSKEALIGVVEAIMAGWSGAVEALCQHDSSCACP